MKNVSRHVGTPRSAAAASASSTDGVKILIGAVQDHPLDWSTAVSALREGMRMARR